MCPCAIFCNNCQLRNADSRSCGPVRGAQQDPWLNCRLGATVYNAVYPRTALKKQMKRQKHERPNGPSIFGAMRSSIPQSLRGNSEKSRHCDQQELEAEALQACLQLMAAHLGRFVSDHFSICGPRNFWSPLAKTWRIFAWRYAEDAKQRNTFLIETLTQLLSNQPTIVPGNSMQSASSFVAIWYWDYIVIYWDYNFLAHVCTRKWWFTMTCYVISFVPLSAEPA